MALPVPVVVHRAGFFATYKNTKFEPAPQEKFFLNILFYIALMREIAPLQALSSLWPAQWSDGLVPSRSVPQPSEARQPIFGIPPYPPVPHSGDDRDRGEGTSGVEWSKSSGDPLHSHQKGTPSHSPSHTASSRSTRHMSFFCPALLCLSRSRIFASVILSSDTSEAGAENRNS